MALQSCFILRVNQDNMTMENANKLLSN